jgi:RNA polymerase sigma factor (sigma-70 family)
MLHQIERPHTRPPQYDAQLVDLVRASAAGDQAAFESLVTRFDRLLRGVTRSYGLSSWDADDVIQATWLQFLQHGRTLREPAAVSGWLATTARRQSLRMLQRHVREHLTDDPARGEAAEGAKPDDELLAAERRELLHDALAELPPRHKSLMRVLVTQPELSYEDVGRLLAMPIGSIGPTRARSLDRLRQSTKLQALQAASV